MKISGILNGKLAINNLDFAITIQREMAPIYVMGRVKPVSRQHRDNHVFSGTFYSSQWLQQGSTHQMVIAVGSGSYYVLKDVVLEEVIDFVLGSQCRFWCCDFYATNESPLCL